MQRPAPHCDHLMLIRLRNLASRQPLDTGTSVPADRAAKADAALRSRGWVKNGEITLTGLAYLKSRGAA